MSTPQAVNPGSGSGSVNASANSGGKRGGGGGGGNRGRGGNRRGGIGGGGGGGRGGTTQTQGQGQRKEKGKNKNANTNLNTERVPVQPQVQVQAQVTTQGQGEEVNDEDEEDVCWICAEPIKYWSVSECNHRTCHVCALRLRALYKKTDCTFCKEPQLTVIFTTSPDTLFSSYKPEDIPYKDAKLAIYFETQEMMEETMILLKFNCPDSSCDYLGNGWADLKLHTRAVHGKLMCDLCLRVKKVFSHEHALYPPNVLPVHLPSMHHRNVKQIAPEKVEGGIHPMCEFCRECFFSVDEHYSHMREKHEECFICKRNGVQFQYFENYNSLERHFNTIHHPCNRPECKERKFVVFNTPLDLQAHMVDEHGANMSSRDKKDARKIQAEFQFDEVGNRATRRAAGGPGSGTPRERDREPPPTLQSQFPRLQDPGPSATVTSGNSNPGQRQPGPVTGRRAAFGGSLTTPDSNPGTPPMRATPSGSTSPVFTDVDPSVTERHMIFLARLQSFAPNPTNAVTAAKLAIRGYRGSELSARDLILTIFNILDNNLDHTASIVNGLVDLLDEDDKKQDLLASWRGFNVEQRRQFPELVPQAIGSGYAGITSGRVLNAKNSTASRSAQRSGQVWDRVAAAASSSTTIQPAAKRRSERFPVLSSGAASGSNSGPAARNKNARTTAWSASATAGANRTPTGASVVEPRSVPATRVVRTGPPPPKLNSNLFPELPTSSTTRERPKVSGNVSLKNILGSTPPTVSAWGGEGSGSGLEETNVNGNGEGEGEEENVVRRSEKGKKGKGKQKQTLFTIGTFAT